MTRAFGFKTADGTFFENNRELDAIIHQHGIDIRAFFNKNIGKDTPTVTEIIALMKTKGMEFATLLSKHNQKVNRFHTRGTKSKTQPKMVEISQSPLSTTRVTIKTKSIPIPFLK